MISMASGIDTAAKVRENKIRRAAERQGYFLVKCRRRDRRARGYGLYVLIPDDVPDRAHAAETALRGNKGMTLAEVERTLGENVTVRAEPVVKRTPAEVDAELRDAARVAKLRRLGLMKEDAAGRTHVHPGVDFRSVRPDAEDVEHVLRHAARG